LRNESGNGTSHHTLHWSVKGTPLRSLRRIIWSISDREREIRGGSDIDPSLLRFLTNAKIVIQLSAGMRPLWCGLKEFPHAPHHRKQAQSFSTAILGFANFSFGVVAPKDGGLSKTLNHGPAALGNSLASAGRQQMDLQSVHREL